MERSSRQSGFSLVELLIAILIAIEILIAAALAFDFNNRLAVTQTQVTDLQQSLRVAQYDMTRLTRMAGRGGMPLNLRPDLVWATANDIQGHAIEVRNNVDDTPDRFIARGDVDSPEALEGTDILIVRGCLTGPVYQVVQNTFAMDVAAGTATMPIQNTSSQGIRQPLAPLCQELRPGSLMMLTSPESLQTFGVAAVTQTDCPADPSIEPTTVNLTFNINVVTPLQWFDRSVAPPVQGFPARMDVVLACALEEYRYYVREEFEDPADATSPLRSRLARARFEPGTETPYRGDVQNFRLDLADGIFDLQVALGLDSGFPSPVGTPGSFGDDDDALNNNNDELIFEGAVAGNARATDDWLYNHPDDDVDSPRYRVHDFPGRVGDFVNLTQVRITALARTARPDGRYRAPDFDPIAGRDMIEDHDYFAPAPASIFNSLENRRFRRRALTTIVDPRNL